AALRAGQAQARVRLPVPLLDVRPGDGRHSPLRARGASAASAPARSRLARRPARSGRLLRARRAVLVGRSHAGENLVIRRLVRFLDERSGAAPFLRKALRYAFPDHWSFLLGEVALYCFVILVGTGIYLTLFFDPSTAPTVYHGSYAPL